MKEELTELEQAVLRFLVDEGDPSVSMVMGEFDLTYAEAVAVLRSIGRKRPRDGRESQAQS